MTLFEYLSIAYSLVISFAAIRLVSGLPHAFDPSRGYFVHVLHVLLILFTTASVFWNFWSFREVEWNFLRFLSALGDPALIYFLACTLIPDTPSAAESWRSYFYSVRKRYFGAIVIWAVVLTVNTTILLDLPFSHPVRGVHAFLLVFGALGLATDNPTSQGVIPIAALLAAVFMTFVTLLPGSLGA